MVGKRAVQVDARVLAERFQRGRECRTRGAGLDHGFVDLSFDPGSLRGQRDHAVSGGVGRLSGELCRRDRFVQTGTGRGRPAGGQFAQADGARIAGVQIAGRRSRGVGASKCRQMLVRFPPPASSLAFLGLRRFQSSREGVSLLPERGELLLPLLRRMRSISALVVSLPDHQPALVRGGSRVEQSLPFPGVGLRVVVGCTLRGSRTFVGCRGGRVVAARLRPGCVQLLDACCAFVPP